MCPGCWCQRCVPQAWVPVPIRPYAHIGSYRHTHTHTREGIHRGTRDRVQACPFCPARPPTLRDSGVGWGEEVRGSLSPQATSLKSHRIPRSDRPSRPAPAYLLQEAFLPHGQLPRHPPPLPSRLLEWHCPQARGHPDQGFSKQHHPFCKEILRRKRVYQQLHVGLLREDVWR